MKKIVFQRVDLLDLRTNMRISVGMSFGFGTEILIFYRHGVPLMYIGFVWNYVYCTKGVPLGFTRKYMYFQMGIFWISMEIRIFYKGSS